MPNFTNLPPVNELNNYKFNKIVSERKLSNYSRPHASGGGSVARNGSIYRQIKIIL